MSASSAMSSVLSLATKFVIAAILISAFLGTTDEDSRDQRPDADRGSELSSGPGLISRAEVCKLWVPEKLVSLARRGEFPSDFRTYEEFQAYLAGRGLGGMWYALSYRGYQINGGSSEITQIRWPDTSPEWYGEFRNVINRVVGKPRKDPGFDVALAEVGIIPERLLHIDPRAAIDQLRNSRVGTE